MLDTHIIIWALLDEGDLSQKARQMILDPSNTFFYSPVSTWEVFLKHRRRPENMGMDVPDFIDCCQDTGFIPLNLSDKHVAAVMSLSRPEGAPEHNDPFDKLLLAQAKAENIMFMTHDSKMSFYNEPCVLCV